MPDKEPSPQQEKQTRKKTASGFQKNDYFMIVFFLLAGVSVMIMAITLWQMRQYENYKLQKATISAALLGDTEVTQQQVSEIEKGLIEEGAVLPFIESIEKARPYFREFSINFISDVPEGKSAPYYLPVEFRLNGSYENIQEFISSLLQSPHVIRIRRVNITSTDGFQEDATLSFIAELYVSNTFVKKQ